MSFILTKNSGIPAKYLIEGYTDNESDVAQLDTGFTLGSKIKVIETGKTYVLMENGWTYLPEAKLTDYYTKEEVDQLIQEAEAMSTHFLVVDSLPTENISTNSIYLVPKEGEQERNIKDEYINIDGTSAGWEKIGDTEIDLSGYATKESVEEIIDSLGALSKKDSVSATYTPEGDVSQPEFTGETATITVTGTPAGSISEVVTEIEYENDTVNSVSSVGTIPTLTYDKETLTLIFDAGTPVTAQEKQVVKTVGATTSAPTFTGEELTSTGEYTPSGTVSKPSFTGTEATITAQ